MLGKVKERGRVLTHRSVTLKASRTLLGRINNVFHVTLLEPWRKPPGKGSESPPMPDLEDEEDYEVEEVRDEKQIEDVKHFLVKWKGWPSEYNQWVPQEDMENATEAIHSYWKRKKEKKPSVTTKGQRNHPERQGRTGQQAHGKTPKRQHNKST